eukprot:4671015-Pleurochrysis_carterae.AAC.3
MPPLPHRTPSIPSAQHPRHTLELDCGVKSSSLPRCLHRLDESLPFLLALHLRCLLERAHGPR